MNMLADSGRKACTKCGEDKTLKDYHRDSAKRDGRRASCKACEKARDAIRYANAREAVRVRGVAYRAQNRERISERKRAYYAANAESERARLRAWHEDNPHTAWESFYRQRAARYGVAAVVESFTRDDLIDRYGDACAHCGGPFEQLDHYPVPVVLGGEHSIENCRPSCADCNRVSWQAGRDSRQAV